MKFIKQVSFLIVLAAMVLSTPLDSSAQQFYDGNKLVEWMPEWEKVQRSDPSTNWMSDGLYVGYVTGVFDATSGILFDPPRKVTGLQVYSIVTKYLKENPEKWNQPASDLVLEALRKAFPKR